MRLRASRPLVAIACWAGAMLGVAATAPTVEVNAAEVNAAEVNVAELAATVRAVGPSGEGHEAAIAAWQELARAEAEQLPELLRAFTGAGPLAVNWLRPAVDTIAERELAAGGQLPVAGLEEVIDDRTLHPLARLVAYEWLTVVEPSARESMLAEMLDDPSLELRRTAVAAALARAEEAESGTDVAEAIAAYRVALDAARDIDQVEAAAGELERLGEPVDLAKQFGFIISWQLVGPFEGSPEEGFGRDYPPEQQEQIDLAAEYAGKEGPITWQAHSTTDAHGMLDLNAALGQHLSAVAYAYADFESPIEREVELRLGSQNGTKVWLNGELVAANAIYHTGANIDQYVGRGRLRAGHNTILVKIHQDDTSEAWAQAWGFQLRVCDALGTAILSSGGDQP